MAEEARLESVCTPKGYREFESRSLRKDKESSPARKRRAVLVCGGLGACSLDEVCRNSPSDRQVVGCFPFFASSLEGHRDSDGRQAGGISLSPQKDNGAHSGRRFSFLP